MTNDDDLDPNIHPTIANAIKYMRFTHSVGVANERARQPAPKDWPFPTLPIYYDRVKPPVEGE